MFHRPFNPVVPTVLPVDISQSEIMCFLIFIRTVMSQGKHFESRTLRRLGPPCSSSDIEPLANVRAKSQANVPTSAIVSSARDSEEYNARLETDGNIMFPDHREATGYDFPGLTRSAIKLGRFIEHPDRPSEDYYDSELPAYCERAVLGRIDCRLSIATRLQKGANFCCLSAKEINSYWSICSQSEMDPIVARLSEKKLLMQWIHDRKVAFLITAYQTHVDARILGRDGYTRRGETIIPGGFKKLIKFPGEMISAICLREVKVVQSPDGEATLGFGNAFWRVYWGLVDSLEPRPIDSSKR